jgi:hypothetical protein
MFVRFCVWSRLHVHSSIPPRRPFMSVRTWALTNTYATVAPNLPFGMFCEVVRVVGWFMNGKQVDAVHVYALFRRLAGGTEEYYEEHSWYQRRPRVIFVCYLPTADSKHVTEYIKVWPTSLEVYKFIHWPNYESESYSIVTRNLKVSKKPLM